MTSAVSSFKYDPFGRRIYKSSSSGTSIYAYDGANLVEETNSSGAAVARYSQGLNIDEPLAMLRGTTTDFYEGDGLGSVTSLTDSTGASKETYTYDSFGKQTASTGSLVNPFQYTARESDSETGLYYYRARYYDPSSGRFLREDPRKNVVEGMDFYAYVRNNPANSIDPYGHGPLDWLKNIGQKLGLAHETKEKLDTPIDWAFCGLYYTTCLEQGMGIRADLAQAMNSPDPVIYATALATLAQNVGANSDSSLHVKVCMNNENCKKALECANKGLTNPLPMPSNWFTDAVDAVKHFFAGDE